MSIYRRPYKVGSRTGTSRFWTVDFVCQGQHVRRSTGLTNRQAAEKHERDLRRRIENGESIDAPGRSLKLADLVDQFCDGYLTETLKRDPMYVYTARQRLQRLGEACGWVFPRDITLQRFDAWRARRPAFRGKAMGAKTCNQYLDIARRFCGWLEKQGHLTANPLRHGEHARVLVNENFRRAATEAELKTLLASVKPERAMFYLFAVYCPMRRGALEQLTWANLHLDATKAWGEIPAAIAKSRKPERFPIPSFLAKRMKGMPGKGLIFPEAPDPARVHKDITDAGLEYVDASGARLDLHAFRRTAVAMLKAHGASLEECQRLLHHKDLRTTLKHYNRLPDPVTVTAVERLPDLMGGSK